MRDDSITPDQIKGGIELCIALTDILQKDISCLGRVSQAVCTDIYQHYDRDMDRLFAVHQDTVHCTKHIAYLAFWIRKLKPVSDAYHIELFDRGEPLFPSNEIFDINERISFYYAIRLIKKYVSTGKMVVNGFTIEKFNSLVDMAVSDFSNNSPQKGPVIGSRLDNILYDMRYRTFGPHHLVHTLSHIINEAVLLGRE